MRLFALWLVRGTERRGSFSEKMYRMGQGVYRDDTIGMEWIEKSAAGGFTDAQCYLGRIFSSIFDIGNDPQKALLWFGVAADAGAACGMFGLGDMYFSGVGVAADPVEALKWFLIGVDVSGAQTAPIKQQLTPDQIAKAEALADGWQKW